MHKITLPLIVVAIFVLGFFITRGTLSKIYSDIGDQVKSVGVGQIIKEKSSCDESCQKEIESQVARAIATLSASQKAVSVKESPTQTSKPQDMYIQISGSGSTKNTTWTDVVGTDFSFDVTRDFEKNPKFAWEGFLKVADANGTAFARIYDVTHSIGVDGSEISVVNKGEFTRVNSINMNFWSGRNTYRVQVKSLNGFEVYYMGGKVRVSY